MVFCGTISALEDFHTENGAVRHGPPQVLVKLLGTRCLATFDHPDPCFKGTGFLRRL